MKVVFDVTPFTVLVGVALIVLTFLFLRSRKRQQSPQQQPRTTPTHKREASELAGQETEADEEEDLNGVEEDGEKEKADRGDPFHESYPHIPFAHSRLPVEESLAKSDQFYQHMNARRSVRMFS